ncbi:MAG: tRNA threonylcarbamoyladenosine biosynthesis protein TsaB [Flavobacteriaceae bacterium]|jgi:tRNA threonylcarbamoyladenosine biosynthesis protein TsaB|uniref:tRNA (adenosine(37)-N6)-threonylcarbamoyltransferase complex dimerization subunit type 1 TsaB n=1 Tax=Candidatus Marifrigoribacter sp. Uisw_064 TaxID=3230970 RepID=UPI003AEB28E5
MAIILCLETSTTNCSVGLSVNGSIVALKEDNSKHYSHAERLHVFIEELLIENKITKANLDAIAVSKGPGSYTGLRIGVSAAKGLCFALGIPLISIPTLEILANQLQIENGIIVSMLDARRMEVYSSVYDNDVIEVRETRAEVLDQESFAEYLNDDTVFFIGDGVEKFKTLCSHKNANFVEDRMPSSNEMALLAEKKYKKSDIEDVAYFEPYYLKDFVTN